MATKLDLRLAKDARMVRSSFVQWHKILRTGAEEIDSARQIEGTDVRFRQIARHREKLHLDFWIGSSESAAVQINQPGTAGSEHPGSTIALDAKRRRYLVRQGDLHGNRRSGRIRGEEFNRRTGLEPVIMRSGDSPARKQWYVVARLDGRSDAAIRSATAEFVSRCWTARNFGEQAAADQVRLAALFGNPERGGWYDLDPIRIPKRVLRVQGYVFEQLEEVLGPSGIEIHKPRHAANYEVDGTIDTVAGPVLIEIKTSVSASDVYCGVGQLTLYPIVLSDLATHAKILLLPGRPGPQLVKALESCGVELHSYELKRRRRSASALFTAGFLRRCGMTERRIGGLVAAGRALA